ncbi:hypothetical protein LguiB_009511 [Lonicera macranthoides]
MKLRLGFISILLMKKMKLVSLYHLEFEEGNKHIFMPAFSHAGSLHGRQSYQIQPCQISPLTASMTYRTSPRMATVPGNQQPYRKIKAGPPFSHAGSLPGRQSYQIQPSGGFVRQESYAALVWHRAITIVDELSDLSGMIMERHRGTTACRCRKSMLLRTKQLAVLKNSIVLARPQPQDIYPHGFVSGSSRPASQGVTHPGISLVQARLTSEFSWDPKPPGRLNLRHRASIELRALRTQPDSSKMIDDDVNDDKWMSGRLYDYICDA